MKITKVANAEARRVFRLCQTGGRLDEAKFSTAIKMIVAEKPRDFRGILSALKRLVRLELERRHVVVESAAVLNAAEQQRVISGLTAKYGSEAVVAIARNFGDSLSSPNRSFSRLTR